MYTSYIRYGTCIEKNQFIVEITRCYKIEHFAAIVQPVVFSSKYIHMYIYVCFRYLDNNFVTETNPKEICFKKKIWAICCRDELVMYPKSGNKPGYVVYRDALIIT